MTSGPMGHRMTAGRDEDGMTAGQRSLLDDVEQERLGGSPPDSEPARPVTWPPPLVGVVDGMSDEEYHRHPALSSSGAKDLMPPGTPATFKWRRDHPVEKPEFDWGKAAHREVLGVGPNLHVVNADDWRTKYAQEQRAKAREAGAVPILARDRVRLQVMAAALREHKLAAAVFDPQRGGKAEQSLFWTDARTGVQLRCRVDWLPPPLPSGRIILGDYKTCQAADAASITRAAWNYRYHWQHAWYCDGAAALGLGDPAFVFVFQEKEPPYLVHCVELDADAVRIGRARNEEAIERFRDCTAADVWPGYGTTDEFTLIGPPPWVRE